MYLILFSNLVTLIYTVESHKKVITTFKLRIVHHNDMMYRLNGYSGKNACMEPDKKCTGGAFQLASAILNLREDAKKTGKTMLYMYAGNSLGASTYNTLSGPNATIEVLNYLRPDVMCLGSNDFDNGINILKRYLSTIKSPILTANMDVSNQKNWKGLKLTRSLTRTIQNMKVGFIGYVNAQTPMFSNSRQIIFNDEYDTIRSECTALRKKGVQFIIAIGNADYYQNKRIATEAPLVDMVISGSSFFDNSRIWNVDPPEISESNYPVFKSKNGKQIPLLQVFGYAKYLGVIDLTFDEIGIMMYYNYTLDKLMSPTTWGPIEANEMLDILKAYMNKIKNTVVGHTQVQINSYKYKCYKSECVFGNMITDAMVEYMATLDTKTNNESSPNIYSNDMPIALIDGGTMSSALGINNGKVTNYELYEAINSREPLEIVTVTGKLLYYTLELNVLQRKLTRNFLQMSGLRVIYNFGKPTYNRIILLKALCSKCSVPIYSIVEKKKHYKILIPKFSLNHVACLRFMRNHAKHSESTNFTVIEILTQKFSQNQFVNPQLDQRIIILNSSNLYAINVFAMIPSVVCFMVKMFY